MQTADYPRVTALLVAMHSVGEISLEAQISAGRKAELLDDLRCTRPVLEYALKEARMQLGVPPGRRGRRRPTRGSELQVRSAEVSAAELESGAFK